MEQVQKGMLLAKKENSYGTDAAPTGYNFMAVVRSQVSYEPEIERVSRDILQGSWERFNGYNLLRAARLSFRTEVRGNRTTGLSATDITSGDVAHALDIDCLLQACDLTPTYTAETTPRTGYVTYTPAEPTDEGQSVTLWFYTGGKMHKTIGCKGNVKGVFEAGKMAYFDWEFRGIMSTVHDVAVSGVSGLGSVLETKPPVFGGASAVVGAWSPVFKTLSFDLGNQIVRREDVNSSNGLKGFAVANRMSKVTIDPETVVEATHPIWGDLISPTSRTISATLGSATGNKCLITAVGESEAVAYAERNSIRTNTITYDLVRALLNDAAGGLFSLKFF